MIFTTITAGLRVRAAAEIEVLGMLSRKSVQTLKKGVKGEKSQTKCPDEKNRWRKRQVTPIDFHTPHTD